ncbi:hypothetical protein EDB84DRAFT_1447424 [Lactarius hengduanensis]|nr:hypothetical protein EDB84DRAFT_1447424 [Lactarius hengduanensis]
MQESSWPAKAPQPAAVSCLYPGFRGAVSPISQDLLVFICIVLFQCHNIPGDHVIYYTHKFSPPKSPSSLPPGLPRHYLLKLIIQYILLDVLTNPDPFLVKDKLSPEVQQLALQTTLFAGHLFKPGAVEVIAFYEHHSDNARKTQNDAVTDADSWLDWYREVVCDVKRLVHFMDLETLNPAGTSLSFQVLKVVHPALPSSIPLSDPPITPTAVVWWSHAESAIHLETNSPRWSDGLVKESGYLSGYSVTLDSKRLIISLSMMDVPITEVQCPTQHADDAEADFDSVLPLLEHHPLNTALDVGEPYATCLAQRIVPQSGFLEEISSNSYKICLSVNVIWLNGVPVSPDELNPYR